jgi:hypothetical protein
MAEAKEAISKIEIQGEFNDRQRSLDVQINHLENFVTDLISHKLSLENANRSMEQMAVAEKDPTKKAKLYFAIRENIELLTKIFHVISEFENIKHRYHKEIDEVVANKIKIIAIDIRRIEDKLNDGSGDVMSFFEKLGNVMANSKKTIPTATASLENNPEYKM